MRTARARKAPPCIPLLCACLLTAFVFPWAAEALDRIPVDTRGLPLWEVRVFDDSPVRIELSSLNELDALLAEVPIASFHREQVRLVPSGTKEPRIVFEPRVTPNEADALRRAGYSFEALPDVEQEVRREMERIWAEQVERGDEAAVLGEKGTYHTHAQVGALLYQAMVDHPAIADTFIIGNSVQGREIWGIRISDNVGTEEAEPEIRLSATMHGNEPPPLEMLLYLVEFLTDEYATDPDAQYIVDNFELHIIPLHNPDGHAVGDRENYNGVDLNRNFPVPDGSIGDDGTYDEEPETIHYKTYSANQNFVTGMDGHSGAVVVNYPWDYTYDLTPDDEAIEQFALEYSTYNLPMYNGSFSQGITRGCLWYVTEGSIQDWSYHETGAIHVIIEYSDAFTPAASALDSLWEEDNKQSFIHWIQASRYGVNGIVTGSDTGLPLDATIAVDGIDKPVYTDPDFGDYYKLLDSGTYDITFSASGYIPETHYGVSTTWGTPTVLNVDLDPVAYGDVSGTVVEAGSGTPLDADIEIRTYPGDTYVTAVQSDSASGGAYTANLVYGEYTFYVAATGHAGESRQVTVDEATETEDFSLAVAQVAVLFEDDFEGGAGQWSGGWGITSSTSHSPTQSIADSPSGSYADYDSNFCAMATSIDMTEAEECTLSFWSRWSIETDWDCVRLEVSTDGGSSYSPVATNRTVSASGQGKQKPAGSPVFEGSQTSWVENIVDLSPWAAETDVRFRLLLLSDSSIHQDGFYFDDFVIRGIQVATGVEVGAPALTRLTGNTPNPFNPATTIRYELAAPAAVDLSVYDIAGRKVRTLESGAPAGAGEHAVVWDGTNDRGEPVASGVYLYRLEAGDYSEVKKMALIR